MKNLTLILILLSTICNSQTIKGTISLNFLKGIGDSSVLSEKATEPIYLKYEYSNKKSKQELISKGETTIETIFENNGDVNNIPYEQTVTTVKPSLSIHYKDFTNNLYRFESEKLDKNLIKQNKSIKDSIPVYEWNLVNETQTIAGYLCKKATTTKNVGRIQNITAWYCEEIPINDGPFDFTGLPGMILQIDIDNSSTLKFENIEFLKNVNTEIEAPENKSEMITIEKYFKN